MKTKLFSAILAVAVVFSVISVPVWAAERGLWDGTAEITGSAEISTDSMVFSYNQDGIGGKASEDKIYKVEGTGSSSSNNWINGGIQVIDQTTLEFSVMFPDNGSKMRGAIAAYKVEEPSKLSTNDSNELSTNANFIVISPSEGMHVFGTADKNLVSGVTIETGKWYHIACTIPGNGGKDYKFYVNGELVKTYTTESASYGARYLRFGPMKNTETSENSTVYFDNIWGYGETKSGAKVFDAAEVTSSEITSVTGEGYSISGNTVRVPEDATVASVLAAITTTDGEEDNVRLYDSTLTTQLTESDLADGGMLVIGAKNGRDYETAYSYYTVTSLEDTTYLYEGTKKLASEIVVDGETASEGDGIEKDVAGVYGKDENDKVYKAQVTGGNYINLASFIKTRDAVVEFSVALAEGITRMDLYLLCYNTEARKTAEYKQFPLLLEVGKTYGSTKIETGKWYNIMVVVPNSGSTENIPYYINGVESGAISNKDKETIYGLRNARIYTNPKGSAVKTVYLDNIRTGLEYYNLAGDMLPSEIKSNDGIVSVSKGKVTVASQKTVADIKSAISVDGYSTLRVYDSSFTQLEDSAEVKTGYKIVVGTTNRRGYERAYRYYEVTAKEYEINLIDYTDGLIYGDWNAYNATTGFCVYVAQYSNTKKLIKVDAFAFEADAAQTDMPIEGEVIEEPDASVIKVFAWDKEDFAPVYTMITLGE